MLSDYHGTPLLFTGTSVGEELDEQRGITYACNSLKGAVSFKVSFLIFGWFLSGYIGPCVWPLLTAVLRVN